MRGKICWWGQSWITPTPRPDFFLGISRQKITFSQGRYFRRILAFSQFMAILHAYGLNRRILWELKINCYPRKSIDAVRYIMKKFMFHRYRVHLSFQINKSNVKIPKKFPCKNAMYENVTEGKQVLEYDLQLTCIFKGSFCPFMVVISSGSERMCLARVP